jgi:hypothetical protein
MPCSPPLRSSPSPPPPRQGLIPAVRSSTRQSTLSNARAVLTMALLDEDVGAILGKRGQTLTQIQQVGVRVCWGVWAFGSGDGGLAAAVRPAPARPAADAAASP